MLKQVKFRIALALLLLAASAWVFTNYAEATRGGSGGRGDGPIVYVRGQGLFYDSVVTADPLAPHGPFQRLEMGPNGLETELGPGDPGYLGGRWAEDFDGDGTDHHFLCPLLGPGRLIP